MVFLILWRGNELHEVPRNTRSPMERLPAIGIATYPIWKCKLFPLEIIAIDKPQFSADYANLNKKNKSSKTAKCNSF